VTVEEAINTSLEYEDRVRDVYIDAVNQAVNEVGKKLFQLMADEEQHHVDYLKGKLRQWKETGKVNADGLSTLIPSRETIEEGVSRLQDKVGGRPGRIEIEFLEKAHAVERETSGFYKQMVDELPNDAKGLFKRFLEIEEGHLAIVQAQLDLVNGTGYWFDVREFNLEG
jgi:rubrerythrin